MDMDKVIMNMTTWTWIVSIAIFSHLHDLKTKIMIS